MTKTGEKAVFWHSSGRTEESTKTSGKIIGPGWYFELCNSRYKSDAYSSALFLMV
jgi:hypothetical protein